MTKEKCDCGNCNPDREDAREVINIRIFFDGEDYKCEAAISIKGEDDLITVAKAFAALKKRICSVSQDTRQKFEVAEFIEKMKEQVDG